MKKILSLLIVLTSWSCNQNSHKEDFIFIYPEGFFTVESQLYFSDGKSFYCSFRDWDHFYELRKTKEQPSMVMVQDKLPENMKFIKECNMGIITPDFFK